MFVWPSSYDTSSDPRRFLRIAVVVVVAVVLLAMLSSTISDYAYWRSAKVAYDAAPGCSVMSVSAAIQVRRSKTTAFQNGCMIVAGKIVAKRRIHVGRGHDEYRVMVTTANVSPREERIAYGDEAPWVSISIPSTVLLQLYRGDVTVIYYDRSALRTWNNPDTQTEENVAMLELLGALLVILAMLSRFWIGPKRLSGASS